MEIWNLIIFEPVLNFLIALSKVMLSFGVAIIILTILVRLLMTPLTLKQLRASKVMSEKTRELQPKIQLLQKKYAKDKQRLSQETMKLYKEVGISPMGCLSSPMLVSMLIQIPIFIAVYQSIIRALATTPQDLLGLSQHLYSWSVVREALPLSGKFLWLNLAEPDFIIPLLVMGTMWLSQKMIMQPATDPKQQSMNKMMQLMMPLMFGFITFTLPSGLGLYFIITTICSIVIQYYVYGWGNLRAPSLAKQIPQRGIVPRTESRLGKRRADIAPGQISDPEGTKHGKHGKFGSKRKDSRGSYS